METDSATPTHDELRAQVDNAGFKYYKFASRINVHPSKLSQYLHGRVPIPVDVIERIRRALDEAK